VRLTINHPSDRGNLPSFQHPRLKEVLKELDLVGDCWDLLRNSKATYLKKEDGESKTAHAGRLERSSYPSFYRDAVAAFAGVLSRYELREAPKRLVAEGAANIDGRGNSLRAWGLHVDALALRDNGCLVMADLPKGRPESRAAERAARRLPRFSFAERRNVLNWRIDPDLLIPSQVTVLEWVEEEDGDYGVKLEPRYRVMKGGEWRLLKVEGLDPVGKGRASVGDGSVIEVDSGTFTGAGGALLTHPPCRWYSPSRDPFGEGAPTLLALANLTLDWFREYSDLTELLHRCALPVAWIRDAARLPGTPLTLGPNSVVELRGEGSEIGFAELAGSSLDKHIQHLANIEKLIDRSTLSFLFSGGGDRTATQAELESAQVQATITGMAEAKNSCWQSLFELWGQLSGDLPGRDAGLDLLPGITDKPVDDALLNLAGSLYDKGLLRRETVTHLAGKRGMLRPGVDAKREAQELDEQDAEAEARLNPPTPGPAELGNEGMEDEESPEDEAEDLAEDEQELS
jgi:hypothetical protein